jgi:hypothetical protein
MMRARATAKTRIGGTLPSPVLAAAALAALLAACAGGSGSSGFLSEAAVIQSVLDAGQCMDLDGLEICPAGTAPTCTPTIPVPPMTATPSPTATTPLPQGTPTDQPTAAPFATLTPTPTAAETPATASPTATPIPGTGIDVAQAPAFSAECGALSSPCLVLQLQVRGFPDGSVFYLASRAADSADTWQLSPTTLASEAPAGGSSLDAALPLPPDANADGAPSQAVQIVVLAFFSEPGELPASVARLADSGADQAFALETVFF